MSRRSIAKIAAVAFTGTVAGTAGAEALPVSTWRTISRLSVHCTIDNAGKAVSDALCRRVVRAAAVNAPRALAIEADGQPDAATVQLLLNGRIEGADAASTFRGTLQVVRPAPRSENSDRSPLLPVRITLSETGPRADRAIHAALVELLPWRQMRRATRHPPRQY